MKPAAILLLFLEAASPEVPWSEFSLSIEPEAGYSSDLVAICRVRVVNHGSRTWPGRSLRFEARALEAGVVVERAVGRFGLSLPPGGALETLIAFSAPYRRFEVAPAASSGDSDGSRRRSGGRHPKRAPRGRQR
ncbi:MAG TPA: hypothetical protein VEG84_06795 [Thermoanaerobaculia bacterium]|nr:hypothetical protein [Thermoanaerobaculia bacterium]